MDLSARTGAILAAASISVAACGPSANMSRDASDERAASGASGDTTGVVSADSIACEAAGGTWGRFGLMAVDMCDLPTADAGEPCSGHDDCESLCIADDEVLPGQPVEGLCYDRTIELGTCLNQVDDGVATGVICID